MTDASGVSRPVVVVEDVEVTAKAKRRRFSASEKLRVLKAADACTETGSIAALLRREGLYSSHLTEWRKARARGELDGLAPRKRGRKPLPVNPLDQENAELKRALAKAEARATRAEALVELQKKISQLLGIPQPGTEDETP
jgi:transposase-like protein